MALHEDYYKYLDVPPTASHDEIRSAFRRMALRYHPDKNKDPWAETIFKQINVAYQVLGNPGKRAAYDAQRAAEARMAEDRQRAQRESQYTRGTSGGRGAYERQGSRGAGGIPCRFCGLRNDSGARYCGNCGQVLYSDSYTAPGSQTAASTHVPSYLAQAILATICCCPPVGILSIVFAAQVNGKVAAGDIKGAKKASQYARSWACVAVGLGIGVWIYSLISLFS